MKLRPTRAFFYFLLFGITSFLLHISCSKDIETLRDAVLQEDTPATVEQDSVTTNQDDGVEVEEEIKDLEERTTVFPSIQDAYLQNGEGYDQNIVRLEENRRTSYIMFDLSPIDIIGGNIISANLEFVIHRDDGSGTIKVFKGVSSDWTEKSLTENSAPKAETLLGEIQQEYYVDTLVRIALDTEELFAEFSTLILDHEDGDDLAFASKENQSIPGPKLVVKYDAPVDAEQIIVENLQILEEEEVSEETGTTQEEETTEEDTTEEETTEEETTEEETTEEETTEEETTEEETNAAPVAIAEAAPSSGVLPLEVTFTGNKSSDDKAITSYQWNFKDNASATTTNATHTFTKAGNYAVTLIVTDVEGLNSTDTVTITVNEKSNEAPDAKVSANVLSGLAPLEVSFTGANSTDDNAVTNYSWNFKDGTSANTANPTHTFNTPGTYAVELTVRDEEGLTDKEFVTITVNEPANEAPIAVATANTLTGDAPLNVNFTGSNSSDDKGIVSYNWDFPEGSSSVANTTATFTNPGVYNIVLTVTDDSGLQDTANLSITVTQGNIGNAGCNTNGGLSGDEGLKTWCWGDVSIPVDGYFSNNQLAISSHCSTGMVTGSGDRVYFKVNPTTPAVQNCGSSNFNYRAEIRDAPADVRHPVGTEQWWGFDYRFGNDYVADKSPWSMWQTHGSFSSPGSPMTSIHLGGANYANSGSNRGEIVVSNAAVSTGNPKFKATGIVPQAGQTLKVVIHMVWGDNNTGLYQVWIDGVKVYDEQERTVYAERPEGGYWKMGIYKWVWKEQSNVNSSASLGISELNTSIGPLKVIKKSPSNSTYLANEYNTVRPN